MHKTVDKIISELRLAMEVENKPLGLIETEVLRMLLDEIDDLNIEIDRLNDMVDSLGGYDE